MCLPAYSLGSTSEIWKNSKMQVATSKKHREIGQFFAPIVTFTLTATKRLKSYERNYKHHLECYTFQKMYLWALRTVWFWSLFCFIEHHYCVISTLINLFRNNSFPFAARRHGRLALTSTELLSVGRFLILEGWVRYQFKYRDTTRLQKSKLKKLAKSTSRSWHSKFCILNFF